MTVRLPSNTSTPAVEARRDEAAGQLADALTLLSELGKLLADYNGQSYVYTLDFRTAQEHVESAWRSVAFAKDAVQN